MISAIDEKISHISTKVTTEKSKITLILKNKIITEESKILHNKFVAFPIDKYDGNVDFVCQRHYAQVLINELSLNNSNNITSTDTKATKPVDKIVSENISFLKNKINLEVTDINK